MSSETDIQGVTSQTVANMSNSSEPYRHERIKRKNINSKLQQINATSIIMFYVVILNSTNRPVTRNTRVPGG